MGEQAVAKHVLIIDDNPGAVRGWRRVLQRSGWRISSAGTIDQALNLLTKKPWRFVILDLNLGKARGESLLPLINRLQPRPVVIVVSGYLSSERIAGWCMWLPLVVPKPVRPRVLQLMLDSLDDKTRSSEWVTSFCNEEHSLSPREGQLLRLASHGCLNTRKVAQQLGVKPGTVRNMWSQIFLKTGCRSRDEVVLAMFEYRDKMQGSHGCGGP